MNRSLLAGLVLFTLSFPIGAAQVVIGMHDGRTTTIELPDEGDTVDLIVELRDRPLFSRERLHATTNAQQRAAAMQSFDDRFAQLARDLGAPARIHRKFERLFSGVSVTVPRADVQRIAKLSYVAAVHADGTVHTMSNDSITKINADKVWTTYGTSGRGVVVAVIDTGIDYTHPALGNGFGPQARVIGGYDFVNSDADPMDDNGHGTHVAGIIGANGSGIIGVAPEVSFLAYKVLGASGAGKDSDVVAGIERATDPNNDGDPSDHADIINMSLGGSGNANSPSSIAAENAVSAGVVVAIAAGNSGGFYNMGSPGSAPSAITVGASDLNDTVAFFSSGGPAVPLAIKPEVVAPGVSILSLAPGGGTAIHSGTSMATPHIAGVAALLRAVHHGWSPDQIKSAIVTTAEVLNNVDVMTGGGGRVDALRAAGNDVYASPAMLCLGRVAPKQPEWTSVSTVHLSNTSNEEKTFTATATGGADGIATSIDPASVTLKPKETRDIAVTVTVKNVRVPFPQEGSLAFSGSIVFTGGAAPVHVRWAFVKSAHVVIVGDANTASFYLSAADGGKTVGLGFIEHTAKNFEFFVPPGVYDAMQSLNDGGDGFPTTRLTFAPRQRIDDETTYNFDPSLPQPVMTKMKRDAQGRTMGDIGRAPGGFFDAFTLLYPPESQGLKWIAFIIVNSNGKDNRLYTTPMPAGFRIGGVESAWNTRSLYIAQYGPSSDLSTLDDPIDPSQWTHVPVRIAVPSGLTRPTVMFGTSLLWRDPLFSSATVFQPQNVAVTGNAWNGDLYMTHEGDSQMTGAAAFKLLADTDAFKGFTMLDGRLVRARSDGIVLWPYFSDGAATYVADPGELLAFGEGLPHPEPSLAAVNGTFTGGVGWVGALGESLAYQSSTGTATLRDANGALVATASPSFAPTTLPAPGVYTYELTKKIGNADATVRATFDSTRADAVLPSFHSMRIVDDRGHVSTSFAAASAASLRFTAIDVIPGMNGVSGLYALVPAAHTSVAWSPHGASAWQPLDTRVDAEELANSLDEATQLGHPAAGTSFVTDLGPLTRTRGDIDLRVHIEDAAGNAVEYVLAPAMTVRDARRRTAGK